MLPVALLRGRAVDELNVVLCTWGLGPGGAERQWVYLASGLRKMGVQVTLLTFESLSGSSAHYLPDIERAQIPHVDATQMLPTVDGELQGSIRHLSDCLGLGVREVDRIQRIASALRELKPNAVCAQLDEPNVFAGLAASLTGIQRIALSFRNQAPTNFPWIHREWMLPAYQWLIRRKGVVCCANSSAGALSYSNWLGVPGGAIPILPNMMAYDSYCRADVAADASVKAELGIDPDDQVVLGVFRLHPEKDPHTFLAVAREVLDTVPRSRFVLVGDGPLRTELQATIDRWGLGRRCQIIGHRHDLPAVMSAASVLLHTSRFEGMSNVVMEAQCCGLPVVGSSIPGVAEAVRDGETAMLCVPGDVAGFSHSLVEILLNRDVRDRMSTMSLRWAAEAFDPAAVCKKYFELLL